MKRSVQEIVELLVFGLIALLVGTGLLWLTGWMFDLVGGVFRFFAGLIWALLRFIVPVALVAAIAYLLVKLLQQGRNRDPARGNSSAERSPATTPPGGDQPVSGAESATVEERTPTEAASTANEPEVVGPAEPVEPTPAEVVWDDDGGRTATGGEPTASEAWAPPQPSPPADDENVPTSDSPWTGEPDAEDRDRS